MTTRALVSETVAPSRLGSKKRSAELAEDNGGQKQRDADPVTVRVYGKEDDASLARVRVYHREDGAALIKVRVCERKDAVGFGKRQDSGLVRISGEADAEETSCQKAVSRDYDRGVVRACRTRVLQEAVSQGVKQAQLLQQQKQTQAPAIRWERFLPQRQLRILLVEDDDSTRHVVSALLRNCSYEVTSVATGLLAWELLMEQTGQLDLVLTEVVMPGLSGIGLLSRIMGHGALKHIPVIMMSSHDSMGVVFKCLSKGAVDFLVKPVRKNELKNLWQHVWRRCHSSSGSGSGSGSGSQTRKVNGHDGTADCDNSVSNDKTESTSSGLNTRGGSDNGSGTQGSWTNRVVEVESSHQHTNCELTPPKAGLVQQYVLTQPEKGSVLPLEHCISDRASGHHLDIAALGLAAAERNSSHKEEDQGMVGKSPATACEEGRQIEDEEAGSGLLQADSSKAIDLIGGIACKGKGNDEEQQGESAHGGDSSEKHASNSPSSKERLVSDSTSLSMLELTLKHPRLIAEGDTERDGNSRNLRHSCSSAFSRYNNTGNHRPMLSGTLPASTQFKLAGYGGQPFPQGSGVGSNSQSSIPLTAQMQRFVPTEGSTDLSTPLPYLSPRLHVNNKQDSGMLVTFPPVQDSDAACMEQVSRAVTPLSPGKVHDGPQTAHGSKSQGLFFGRAAAPFWGSPAASVAERGEADDCCVSYEQSQSNQRSQIHHHSHHRSHHHHHHVQHHFHYHCKYASQQRPMTPQDEDQMVTNSSAGAPKCGSSSMANGPEGNNGHSGSSNNNGNISLNESAAGSNNGSNGQSAVVLPARGNGDTITQPKNGREGTENCLVLTQGLQSAPDQNRFASREAALTKFRQKRKARCFEKKVRYQSRKRLAEQRPRVRGQFVRQSVNEFAAGEPQ